MSYDPTYDAQRQQAELQRRMDEMARKMQQAMAQNPYTGLSGLPKPQYAPQSWVGAMSTLGIPVNNTNMYPSNTNSRRKFQDGDRVIHKMTGKAGTVNQYTDDGWGNGMYEIYFDDGQRGLHRSNELDPESVAKKAKVTIDSVILGDDKKEQIRAAISQVEHNQKIFEEWGFSEVFEKGTAIALLFWGIPGTGKTLMAQAIADNFQFTLKIYGPAEIQSSEPGGAERAMQAIFKDAKQKKNMVLLFDECDSLLMDRNEVGPILSAQVNTLLAEIEKYDGIVIFTTNRMGKLDPALERRITTKVEFPFPDKKQREAIWKRLMPKKAPLARDVDFRKLSEYPLAGGNIKNAVLNAARKAAYLHSSKINMSYFIDAIEKEAESLQSFIAEYDKNPHQSLVSGGGMSMGEGMSIKRTATMGIKGGTNGS